MRRLLVVFTALSLMLMLVTAFGVANAKSPKPQDQVKNFTSAAAGLKVSKAAGYWVTAESTNVSSQLAKVPSGTKISLSKLKLVVANQTADTAEVTATYTLKVQLKGQKKAQQSSLSDTFNLKLVSGVWLISGTTMWDHWTGLVATSTPTATATSATSVTTTPAATTSGNPVKIGAIAPWSGPMAMTGMLADTVIKLAEKQVHDMGGILGGRDVKVVRYDSAGTVAGCVAGATKLLKEDKVSVLVYGGASGADNVAVSDFAEQNHILYVCYSGLPNLAELKYAITGSLVWDNWPPECKFTNEVLKPKTVATLSVDTTDGRDHIEGYLKGIAGLGAKVVYKEYTSLDVNDFSSYLTKIKYANPDTLMLFYSASEPYISIAKQMMELGGWGNIKVICEPGAENAIKQAGAQGWYVFEPWLPGLTSPGAVKFENDFKAMYDKLPNSSQLYFYNPLWAAIYAIQLAGTDSDLEKIAEVARSGNLEWDSPMGHAHYTADGSANLWTIPTHVEDKKLIPVQTSSQ